MRYLLTPLLGLTAFTYSNAAWATYSVVAADLEAGRIGGAGTSCLGGSDVSMIYAFAPDVGVVHAQALFNRAARDRAVELLTSGDSPSEVIAAITAVSFDRDSAFRQYAIVNLSGDVAAHTGTATTPFSSHSHGSVGQFAYSVQGNYLTSAGVISRAVTAFSEPACDLPERLMRALEAGAENGEGDSRCANHRGIPSDSAFLRVEPAHGEPAVALSIIDSGAQNPLAMLRDALTRWRSEHPCIQAPDPTTGTATTAADQRRGAAANPTGRGCSISASPHATSAAQSSAIGGRLALALFCCLALILRRQPRSTIRGVTIPPEYPRAIRADRSTRR